ncbi:unnamed protein product [Sphenostylis stenocarpa]|uniref:Uncharacterized protein n=1 Tax=Sphenostylis stenocarpa TaxID=92480 RepID=A0AA86VYQ9_9FABA|nr:unnamed protein product [Sphenostylis stenocarpa]
MATESSELEDNTSQFQLQRRTFSDEEKPFQHVVISRENKCKFGLDGRSLRIDLRGNMVDDGTGSEYESLQCVKEKEKSCRECGVGEVVEE